MNKSPLVPAVPHARPSKYLSFTLGSETYAFPILAVREIIRLCPVTPVPKMPAHVKGVINLRGSIVTVLDLRTKFHIAEGTYGDRTCIIVVQVPAPSGGSTLMGAIVDTVEEVVTLGDASIEPAPDFGGTPDTRFILGVSTAGGGVKTLLDVNKIFVEDDAASRPASGTLEHSGGSMRVSVEKIGVEHGGAGRSPRLLQS